MLSTFDNSIGGNGLGAGALAQILYAILLKGYDRCRCIRIFTINCVILG